MARLAFDDGTELGGCGLHGHALASLSQLVDWPAQAGLVAFLL